MALSASVLCVCSQERAGNIEIVQGCFHWQDPFIQLHAYYVAADHYLLYVLRTGISPELPDDRLPANVCGLVFPSQRQANAVL